MATCEWIGRSLPTQVKIRNFFLYIRSTSTLHPKLYYYEQPLYQPIQVLLRLHGPDHA